MERFYPNLDLKFLANCPICSSPYNSKEIKILDKNEGVVTLYFICAHCKSAIVSAVSAGVLGVTAISIITDLGASEIDKLKNTESINSNDVLALYSFLKSNN